MKVISLFFFVTLITFSTSSSRAQCAQWDVSGYQLLKQGTTSVALNLIQNGSLVSGNAEYDALINDGADFVRIRGDVDGSVQGNNFNVHVYWNYNGLIGVYDGVISPQGRAEGDGYGKENPSKKFLWFIRDPVKCSAAPKAASPLPGPEPQPIHHAPGVRSTGRPRATTPTPVLEASADPVKPVPPAFTAPGITASPNNIALVKGKSKGTTTLTWDAGRAHPSAEVWVKIDDEDETKVVATAKGTLEVTVIPGKSYLYSLRDAGKTLARLVVEFHR